MKKMIVKYWVWFIVMFMVAPVHAQQYDDLWKEAEELQKRFAAIGNSSCKQAGGKSNGRKEYAPADEGFSVSCRVEDGFVAGQCGN